MPQGNSVLNNTRVRYHGSKANQHGEYRVLRLCLCRRCNSIKEIVRDHLRYELVESDADSADPESRQVKLKHVRRESFTVL